MVMSDKTAIFQSMLKSASPDKPNIYYQVKPRTSIEVDFLLLLSSLREKTIETPRILVYCQSLDTCADLYAHFHAELAKAYYPPGSPHLSDYRLFCMFHAHSPQHNKDVILRGLLDLMEWYMLYFPVLLWAWALMCRMSTPLFIMELHRTWKITSKRVEEVVRVEEMLTL